MAHVTPHTSHQPPVLQNLSQRKKDSLAALCAELVTDVELLDRQLAELSPQATLLFNSNAHPDVEQQIAQAAIGLMRLCASLNMDFTEAIESRILQQESELFGQQDLQL